MLCLPYTDRPFTGLFFVCCFLIEQASNNLVWIGEIFINKSTIIKLVQSPWWILNISPILMSKI